MYGPKGKGRSGKGKGEFKGSDKGFGNKGWPENRKGWQPSYAKGQWGNQWGKGVSHFEAHDAQEQHEYDALALEKHCVAPCPRVGLSSAGVGKGPSISFQEPHDEERDREDEDISRKALGSPRSRSRASRRRKFAFSLR